MHPVEANDYLIASKPIEEYSNWCVASIEAGKPGKVMTASFRVGKTYGTRWFIGNRQAMLKEDVPTFALPQRFHTAVTPKKFFSHVLSACGNPLFSGDESALRSRVVQQMAEMCEHMEHKRVVMFIDEAQWLERSTYNLLINLANELSEIGIRLIVLMVASPEMDATITRYKTLKRGHIVGRFMSEVFHLRGIESSDHLRHAWQQFDFKQFHPVGSDVSYTRAFAGDRFANGLTLSGLAADGWEAMESVFRLSGGAGPLSVPMETVTLLANELLLRVIGDLEPPYLIPKEQWLNVLDQVNFLDQLSFLSMTPAPPCPK